MNEKVILDKNVEANGMGGNDEFFINGSPRVQGGTIKINGGAGSDTINRHLPTMNIDEDMEIFVTGGGPERDVIEGGQLNDYVIVENDKVTDIGGTNTFLLRGKGGDVICTGPSPGLIVVNKESGATQINPYSWPKGNNQKPKRIVYERGSLTKYGKTKLKNKPFVLRGSSTPHDVLRMTNFKPVTSRSSKSSDPVVVLVPDLQTKSEKKNYKNLYDIYFDAIHKSNIYRTLFRNTLCSNKNDPDAVPPVFCPKAKERASILYNQIERLELSEYAANLVLIGCTQDNDRNAAREIISGPKDLYAIQPWHNTPLIVEMGTGTNRVCSGKGNDAYSLILDKSLDIIYDKGGENLVAVALPEGVTFYDVWLDILDEEYILYCGREKESATKCLRYIFHGDEDSEAKDQFMFRERTGKEFQFKMLLRPRFNPKRQEIPPWKLQLIFYFTAFKDMCASDSYLSSISPAKGEKITYGCSLHNPT